MKFRIIAGTMMVSITGRPAAQGQNTDVYSIIHSMIQPGVSEKVVIGMNIQKWPASTRRYSENHESH